jgi:RIO kinase 1
MTDPDKDPDSTDEAYYPMVEKGDSESEPDSDHEADSLMVKKVDRRRDRNKDASDYISHEGTVTLATRKLLFDMLNTGIIESFTGIISSGKEANVYCGIGKGGKEIAIKIHRQISQTSKWMQNYIIGDPRFSSYRKKNVRDLMVLWTLKEYKNLMRARDAGVPVPAPIHAKENILVMDFLGHEGTPAKRLVDVNLDDPVAHFQAVAEGMQALLIKAHLVHGDLSPYNLLLHDGKLFFIDFAQGVLTDHPNAQKYFQRDFDNVVGYFGQWMPESFDRDQLFRDIVAGRPIKIVQS